MRRIGRALAFSFLLISPVACAYRDWEPIVHSPAQSGTPDAVFADALSRARRLGYRVLESDEEHRFATFLAGYGDYGFEGFVYGGVVVAQHTNYFILNVHDDSRIEVWASGPDVRGREIHKVLKFELEAFAARVAGHVVQVK